MSMRCVVRFASCTASNLYSTIEKTATLPSGKSPPPPRRQEPSRVSRYLHGASAHPARRASRNDHKSCTKPCAAGVSLIVKSKSSARGQGVAPRAASFAEQAGPRHRLERPQNFFSNKGPARLFQVGKSDSPPESEGVIRPRFDRRGMGTTLRIAAAWLRASLWRSHPMAGKSGCLPAFCEVLAQRFRLGRRLAAVQ